MEPTEPGLPPLALGSSALLLVERAAALFVLWMGVAVIVAHAWRGRLPVEVSGQGVRYADARVSGELSERTAAALRRQDAQIADLRRELAAARAAQDDDRYHSVPGGSDD